MIWVRFKKFTHIVSVAQYIHTTKEIINFVQPYTNILTQNVQYIMKRAIKKLLQFEITCTVYLEHIVTITLSD